MNWPDMLEDVLLNCAPPCMSHVHTMMCGACSIENALKVAFYVKRKKERGDSIQFSQFELDTVLNNLPPGAPDLSVLSFKVLNYLPLHAYLNFKGSLLKREFLSKN